MGTEALRFLAVHRRQLEVIDYLKEENRVLRSNSVADDQWRRVASKGRLPGRQHLADLTGIVTPETSALVP